MKGSDWVRKASASWKGLSFATVRITSFMTLSGKDTIELYVSQSIIWHNKISFVIQYFIVTVAVT